MFKKGLILDKGVAYVGYFREVHAEEAWVKIVRLSTFPWDGRFLNHWEILVEVSWQWMQILIVVITCSGKSVLIRTNGRKVLGSIQVVVGAAFVTPFNCCVRFCHDCLKWC